MFWLANFPPYLFCPGGQKRMPRNPPQTMCIYVSNYYKKPWTMLKSLKLKILVLFGILLTGFGLTLTYVDILSIIGTFLFSFGIVGLIFTPIIYHIRTRKSVRLLGFYLILFLIVNIIRHYQDFYSLYHLKDLIENDFYYSENRYLIHLPIWFIMTIWLLKFSVQTIMTDKAYETYLKRKESKIIITIIIVLTMLELPIFGWHLDFVGGLHGHSFWGNLHFH